MFVKKCKGFRWFRRSLSKSGCFYAKRQSIRSALVARNICQQMKWKMLMLSGRDIDRRTLLGLRIFGPPSFCPRVAREMSIRPDMIRSYFVSSTDSFVCSRDIWHFCRFLPHTTRPPFTFRRVFPVSCATCAERRTEFPSSLHRLHFSLHFVSNSEFLFLISRECAATCVRSFPFAMTSDTKWMKWLALLTNKMATDSWMGEISDDSHHDLHTKNGHLPCATVTAIGWFIRFVL